MKQARWSRRVLRLALSLVPAIAVGGCFAQQVDQGAAAPPAPASATQPAQRPEEISDDTRRLIDAVRRLNEEPGLILRRESIYEVVGARAVQAARRVDNRNGRYLAERFLNEGPLASSPWKGELIYLDYPKSGQWVVRVVFRYPSQSACISSRIVEAYWGKPFKYQPMGVHEQLREMTLPAGVTPTGPHDGVPFDATFPAMHSSSANSIFGIGRGGCLIEIIARAIFNQEENSNENVYYK